MSFALNNGKKENHRFSLTNLKNGKSDMDNEEPKTLGFFGR